MDKWELMHAYRHKVAKGEANEIRCPDCQDILYTVVGSEDEPVLKCFFCRNTITPGLDVWDQIKRVLNDD